MASDQPVDRRCLSGECHNIHHYAASSSPPFLPSSFREFFRGCYQRHTHTHVPREDVCTNSTSQSRCLPSPHTTNIVSFPISLFNELATKPHTGRYKMDASHATEGGGEDWRKIWNQAIVWRYGRELLRKDSK